MRKSPKSRPAAKSMPHWGAVFFAAVIFLLAIIVRLVPLEEYHNWDESIYLQHAEQIAFGKANYSELAFRPPLLSILFAGGFLLWHSPFIASIIVALLSASIALAIFFIGRRLHSSEAGLFAALIVAVHPLFVRFGHLLLTDAAVGSFLALALLFALHEEWWALLLCGAALGLAGLTKFTGLGAAIPLLAIILYQAWTSQQPTTHKARKPRRALLQKFLRMAARAGLLAAGFLLVFTPYLYWVNRKFGSATIVFDRAQAIVNVVHGGPWHYFSLDIYTIPLLGGMALFVWFWKPWKKESWKSPLVPFILMSVLWLALIIGYLYTFPNREHRYALAAVVPLFVLAGVGYAAIVQQLRARKAIIAAVVFVVLILALSFNSFVRLTEPTVNHWKPQPVDMALQIRELNNTGAVIYTTSDYPVYGYYTNNRVVVVDGPQFVDAYPRIMPRDGYLTVYKHSTREPTLTWADRQPELQRIAENEQIVLYAYDSPWY